jgi:oxygen-independent coproporphyrinogen-3 oxidase
MEAPDPSPGTMAVSAPDLAFEFMLNALRLKGGFTLDGFSARTGLDRESVAGPLAALEARGLIERLDGGSRIVPSERGFAHLNELQAAFLPDPAA